MHTMHAVVRFVCGYGNLGLFSRVSQNADDSYHKGVEGNVPLITRVLKAMFLEGSWGMSGLGNGTEHSGGLDDPFIKKTLLEMRH